MNADDADPLMDSFLDELLGDKKPPDLMQSILHRLDQEQKASPESVTPENRSFYNASSLPRVWLQEAPASRRQVAPKSLRPSMFWLSLGTAAAALVLLVTSLQQAQGPRQDTIAAQPLPIQPDSQGEIPEGSAASSVLLEPSVPTATSQPQVLPSPSHITNVETDLERAGDTPRIGKNPQESPSLDLLAMDEIPHVGSTPIPNRDILQVIDSQFAELWKNNDVEMPSALDHAAWLERVTTSVLDRMPTERELAEAAGWTSVDDRLLFAETLVKTDEFAERWGHWLSQQWLPAAAMPVARRQFQEWIKSSVHQGLPLYALQAELFETTSTRNRSPVGVSPASIWISQMAKGGNEKFAEQFCRRMLEQTLVCSRCHEGYVLSQAEYWGVASLFSSLKLKALGNRADRIEIRPPQPSYYETKEGTLVASGICLPDGTEIAGNQPIASLRRWFVQSASRRQALVSNIWGELFGAPLVPPYALAEQEGRTARIDLRDFLADQWTVQGEDLRRMVVWLVCSRPFSVPSETMHESEYLLTSSSQLENRRMRDRLFANFVGPSRSRWKRGESERPRGDSSRAGRLALRELAECLKQDRDVALRGTLGQIDSRRRSNMMAKSSAIESLTNRHPAFVIHADHLETALEDYVQAWNASRMAWDAKVQHAFWLSVGADPTPPQRELARQILEYSGDEPALALRRILLVEFGYY